MAEPWDDPRITTFGMLLEAYAALMTTVGRGLDTAAGLPVAWLEVLLRLARSPEHRLRMGELAAQVGLSTSGMTRLVDRVEEAGYVRREACPGDRRSFHAVLTDKAEALLRDALPRHLEEIERCLIGPLDGQQATFESLLRSVRDANGPGACPG